MSLLFLSHSSLDNSRALALQDWLVREGWDDLFLDLDPERGIVAGERWERALHQAAQRCDAVLFLVSRHWLVSEWCLRELHLAQRLNKRIFVLLVEDIPLSELPAAVTGSWQVVNLASGSDHEAAREVVLPGHTSPSYVTFSASGLQRLRNGLQKAGLDPHSFPWPPASDPDRPPYRGLRPLEAEDAGIFFGRDAQIIDLLAQLRGLSDAAPPRLLAILGASGAGKSSFLRAGILPRLARDDRNFLPLPVIRPELAVVTGPSGLLACLRDACRSKNLSWNRKQLSDAVNRGAAGLRPILSQLASNAAIPDWDGGIATPPTLVLSIDQGEELFQAEGQEEARQFLAMVCELLSQDPPRLIAVFTIRSDSYEQLQSAAELQGVSQRAFSLPPMPRGAYRQVIGEPAMLLAKTHRPLKIDPQLTEALLQDIERGGAKDALPLLAFTLERLYLEYGDDGDLRLDEYHELGRIEGAIETAVELALKAAMQDPKVPRDRDECLKLLRRALIPWLAGIDPQTNLPRRKVAKLNQVPEEARALIQHFVEHRLLSTDIDEQAETTVEPAHEALLRQWAKLRGWLEEDAVALATLESVKAASRDWEANDNDPKWLIHQTGRLEDGETLQKRADLRGSLDASDLSYLTECRKQEDGRRNQELMRARELASARRSATARLKTGLVITGLLAVMTLFAFMDARENRMRAEVEREAAYLSESRHLLDLSKKELLQNNFDVAELLALEGLPGVYGGRQRPLLPQLDEARLLARALSPIEFTIESVGPPICVRVGAMGVFVVEKDGRVSRTGWDGERVFAQSNAAYDGCVLVDGESGGKLYLVTKGALHLFDPAVASSQIKTVAELQSDLPINRVRGDDGLIAILRRDAYQIIDTSNGYKIKTIRRGEQLGLALDFRISREKQAIFEGSTKWSLNVYDIAAPERASPTNSVPLGSWVVEVHSSRNADWLAVRNLEQLTILSYPELSKVTQLDPQYKHIEFDDNKFLLNACGERDCITVELHSGKIANSPGFNPGTRRSWTYGRGRINWRENSIELVENDVIVDSVPIPGNLDEAFLAKSEEKIIARRGGLIYVARPPSALAQQTVLTGVNSIAMVPDHELLLARHAEELSIIDVSSGDVMARSACVVCEQSWFVPELGLLQSAGKNTGQLVVTTVGSKRSRVLEHKSTSGGFSDIYFDRKGSLLFVLTESGLHVWDAGEMKQLKRIAGAYRMRASADASTIFLVPMIEAEHDLLAVDIDSLRKRLLDDSVSGLSGLGSILDLNALDAEAAGILLSKNGYPIHNKNGHSATVSGVEGALALARNPSSTFAGVIVSDAVALIDITSGAVKKKIPLVETMTWQSGGYLAASYGSVAAVWQPEPTLVLWAKVYDQKVKTVVVAESADVASILLADGRVILSAISRDSNGERPKVRCLSKAERAAKNVRPADELGMEHPCASDKFAVLGDF